MPKVMTEDEVPVIYVQLSDRRGSGFILDGTENTPNPVELNSPGARYIPNVGKRRGEKMVNGKLVYYHEPIRYIRGETEISIEKQKLLGIEPARLTREDKIVIQSGEAVIARDLGNEGLYDYLMDVFYNETNPHRSAKATAIFKIVEQDLEAEENIDYETALADALVYLTGLSTKVGEKLYKYNEEKIDGLCSLMTVFADSPATKLKSLIQFAKTTPVKFMQAVTKWEQTTETEVTRGLHLNVIKFNKNAAEYVDREKIIKTFGTEKMGQDQKISALADWFRTSDGFEAYNEFKAYLEVAKEKV